MLFSIKFSTTLQNEILSTVTLDLLKQMIILKSFKSVFGVLSASDSCHRVQIVERYFSHPAA